MVVMGLKMAKKVPKIEYVSVFLPFLDLLQPLNLGKFCEKLLLAHLESAYSLIWGSHKIWEKGGGDTLDLL